MKKLCILIICLFSFSISFSQGKYLTKEGFITFFSHTLVEDIKADNHQVVSVLDTKTGEIAVQLLMKSFMFKKALMQEHFNDSYVESHKYPKATFKGFIQNFNTVVGSELVEVEIKGTLTVHGKQKEISTKATFERKKESIILKGNFNVEVADFNIKIPTVVVNNIAKVIKVSFELNHKPYN